MSTLTLIGEPFPDNESRLQAAASRCLTEALAETAPRGCSSRLIVAKDTTPPELSSARASVEAVPLTSGSLPLLWRTGTTARPLDGEFVHSNTPLVPLRSRTEDDGSQTSVVIPHTLAWDAPELMGVAQARSYRSFVKRAARLADALLAPTHAVAERLQQLFPVEVRVLPLAAPLELLAGADAAERRARIGLAERYLATTALPGQHGRLEWLLDAMERDAELPQLAVLHFGAEPLPPVRDSLSDRVRVVQFADPATELADFGAVIAGARLLALPQTVLGAGYEVLGAIAAHVPVLHAGCAAAAELALDAAVGAPGEAEFAAELALLMSEAGAERLQRLRILAEDRSRSTGWRITAWQLWELHANL